MTQRVFYFGRGAAEGDPARRDLLGGKGAGLAEMTQLGLPVPAGLTISTEGCFAFLQHGELPIDLKAEVEKSLSRVEAASGSTFGDAANPLLVSVRSGARASMPGMMDTILNLGLTSQTVEGLAKRSKNRRFALDAYRRLIHMYGTVALSVGKAQFEHALDEMRVKVAHARNLDVGRLNSEELKRKVPDSEIGEAELEQLVSLYKAIVLQTTGQPFPDDAREQLWGAITAVFRSWNNPRAIYYRRMHDIPDAWGTACNVQSMVFGNLGENSATGVAFTRNPSTGEQALYGEWLPNAQGEDVVAGIRTPMPITALASLDAPETSLERKMPQAFAQLVKLADQLELHFRDMQDLEFTIQDGQLYMLQCRAAKRTSAAAVRIAVEFAKEGRLSKEEAVLRVDPHSLDQLLHPTLDPTATKKTLAKGLPASPGAASGQIVFTADEAEKKAGQGIAVVLVRIETSPEDIHGMKAARGILTARGGMTSHAAVVARGMGKPCVAGTSAISIDYAHEQMAVTLYADDGMPFDTITLKKGDLITLDGGAGMVYQGAIPTVPAALSAEFAELMEWADGARTMKVRANADTPLDARTARAFGAEGIGLCRTEHMFFDERRIAAMREMILAETVEQRETALVKLLPHQRNDFIGIFHEMRGLPVTIRLLDPPLHEFLPTTAKQVDDLAKTMGVSPARLGQRTKELHEFNPMLGHRGCRLAITYPEIYAMQIRAILEAAFSVARDGKGGVFPEIMIPLALSRGELDKMRVIVSRVVKDLNASDESVQFTFGTMIELPRAAIVADELAESAEFFSFGTNDLTQTTMGLSRDDAGKFLGAYVESGILPKDPFVSIDVAGVGALVSMAIERGRKTRPQLKLGICGEHGGDPASITFFQDVGLDYVSCSPFRVPIARLAAAQAALVQRGKKVNSSTV